MKSAWVDFVLGAALIALPQHKARPADPLPSTLSPLRHFALRSGRHTWPTHTANALRPRGLQQVQGKAAQGSGCRWTAGACARACHPGPCRRLGASLITDCHAGAPEKHTRASLARRCRCCSAPQRSTARGTSGAPGASRTQRRRASWTAARSRSCSNGASSTAPWRTRRAAASRSCGAWRAVRGRGGARAGPERNPARPCPWRATMQGWCQACL